MIGKGVHRKQSTIKHNTIFKVHIIMMSNIEDWGTFIITHLKRLNPAEGYGIKYEGSFLEKSQSGCVQNCCHFVCLHHFWAKFTSD